MATENAASATSRPPASAAQPDFRLLGPLEVHARGQMLQLGGPKPRTLLAVLLLRAGEVVSADALIEELWGDSPARSARHLLHVYVSGLRKALEGELGSRGLLVSRAPGYALAVDAEAIDVRRFERMLDEGRRLLVAQDPGAAAATLREALALWRGPALSDFTYQPFAQAEIARLEELRLVALEERIDAELGSGRHRELVGELELLVAQHPLRERPRGQLMLALYRSGRQADALEAYRAARRLLVDELGIEPGSALRQLQQAILRHDAELEPPAAATAPLAVPTRAERRLVTVLVAGVADSEALDVLDPEARDHSVSSVLDVVADAVRRHGGAAERAAGEELVGVFGVPGVREDDALRAVRAAWEARDELDGGEARADVPGVRTAVETGEVVVEGDRGGLTGDAVARAARLSRRAAAGEILLGARTYRLVRHAVVAVAEPGPRARQRGLEGRRLLGLVPDASVLARRFDSPLVGRSGELAVLSRACNEVVADCGLRLVTVVGEAGVGKSRLGEELVASLGETFTALVGRCPAYGEGGAFRPLRAVLAQAAGEPSVEAILRLLGAGPEAGRVSRRVAAAVGATADVVTREDAFWAFRRLFEALARVRPLLLVLEDVHWAQTTLLELVEHLADWSRDASVLVLCLGRPDLLEDHPSWAEGRSNVSRLVLAPLSHDESRSLVENLAGRSPLPEETRARIASAAEGNPLFVEQMLAMLAEERPAREAIELPPTIQAVLAARLDRLGPAERAVLDRAAVAGREFSRASVAALLPDDARAFLPRHLSALVQKQYLDGDPPGPPATATLRFHHALIQEAAYRSIPKRLRAELHERLADWLEHEPGEGDAVSDAIIGFHLEQAFRHREELHELDWHARRLAERAAERLGAAGRVALAGDDTPAAAGLLDRAAALRDTEDPKRLELLPDLVLALRETAAVERASGFVAEAVAGAAASGDAATEARARIERSHLRLMIDRDGGVDAALAEGDRCVALFEALGDELGQARAWQLVALAHRLRGHQTARLEALWHALRHAERAGDLRLEGRIRDHIGGIYNYGPPHVEEGIRYVEESLRWAREHGDRVGEADALAHGRGRFGAMVGEFERAREAVAEARAIFVDLGLVMFVAGHASAAGFVETMAGDLAAAERELRAGYALVQRSAMRGSYFGMGVREELAQAVYARGRYEEAKALSEESERLSAADDLQAQVQWRSVRAKVLAREGRSGEAEALAREALALAERTELVLVHACALLDLAEVLRLDGRTVEALAYVGRARQVYELKGDLVSAERTRAAAAELERGGPSVRA